VSEPAPSLCVFASEGQLYAVRTEAVTDVVRVDGLARLPLAPPTVAGLLVVGDESIPAVALTTRRGEGAASTFRGLAVLIRSRRGALAILADRIEAVVAAGDAQPVGRLPDSPPWLAPALDGCWQVEAGSAGVLDPDRLADLVVAGPAAEASVRP